MANYPGSLDDFTNPTASDNLSTPAVLHPTQHANVNDAVEALEAKVGIGSGTAAAAATGAALVKQSDGTTAYTGVVTLTTAQTITATKTFSPATAAGVALIVKGLAGQTGNLQEWQDSAGVVAATIDASAYATFNGFRTTASNTGVGRTTLSSLTSGIENVAVGVFALAAVTSGSYHTAVGSGALDVVTTAAECTAVGRAALGALTTGDQNVAVGGSALEALTTGTLNTAIGHRAGDSVTTGQRNTFVGRGTDLTGSTTLNDTVALGYQALAGHDNGVAIGSDTATARVFSVAVGPRDVEVQSSAKGLVLRSPDSTIYRVTVANGGGLVVTAI